MERLDHGLSILWCPPREQMINRRLDDIVSELEADALTKELTSQLKTGRLFGTSTIVFCIIFLSENLAKETYDLMMLFLVY
jgi:hypothetical protein